MNKTRIYSGPLSLFGAKAQIAALEKGLAFELVMVPFDRNDNYLPKHPEVLRVNPKAQVPVLIDDDVELFDSTQIFEYLEDRYPTPPLWPRDVAARARARQIELRADEVFFPHIYKLFGLQDDMQGAAAQAACAACQAIYGQMEKLLADRDYLAGPYSYADIGFYMACVFADRKGAGMSPATPRLIEWRTRVGERSAVRAVVDPMMQFLASQGRGVPAFLKRQ
ncbi:MAG: glutathione S-transferase family protein [Proteobacteria bacterium]|nr:glutathione S-transferase family protein [Pseudomonadota bacterium]